jgi:hypothetical protein
MNKLAAATLMAAGLAVGGSAQAATEAECKAMWDKADTAKTGQLKGAQAQPYLQAMKSAPGGMATPQTGAGGGTAAGGDVLTMQEFMTACRNDAFKNVKQ